MCQRRILDQEIIIFGTGTGRTAALSTNRKLGLNAGQARFLEFHVLEQTDLGATITVSQGGRVLALFGGIACDEIVGRQLEPLKLDTGINTLDIKSDGALTLVVSAVEG